MSPRQATAMQRQALYTVHKGHCDPANIAGHVGVQGGYSNEAEFLQRLIDRGWLDLAVTDDGYRALGFEQCGRCKVWHDPDEGGHCE